jgi:hypothetical protein
MGAVGMPIVCFGRNVGECGRLHRLSLYEACRNGRHL